MPLAKATAKPLMQTDASKFLTLASDVASFYGFRPIKEVEQALPAHERVRPHTFASVANACSVRGSTEPVLAYYASPSPSYLPATLPPGGVGEFGLQIVGTNESVGEIVLLKTAAAILREWGADIARVRINALGDKDSKLRFARELSLYLRKHAANLDEECRTRIATEPLAPYTCTSGLCREVVESGPRPMNFLSEKSRAHFRQVLEHLEGLGLPYELDDLLVGDEREPRLSFALDIDKEDGVVLGAHGGRFDEAVRRAGRKELGVVHASLYIRKKGLTQGNFSVVAPARVHKIFFVQLGLRAKLQGLHVLDTLHRAHIPVLQSFDSSRLSPQIDTARRAGVTHLMIMGQREALDGTVIVRTMDNSAQTVVGLDALPKYLRSLR